jgi:hypothetical protein
MTEAIYEKAIQEYAQLFERMTPESLGRFDQVFTHDALFKDPFNEVRGVDAIRNIFEHMYRVCERPRFKVNSITRVGNTAWLHWIFDCTVRKRTVSITGASMVVLSDAGRVSKHLDYWDAAGQVYEKLPLIGWLLKKLRSMFAVPQE